MTEPPPRLRPIVRPGAPRRAALAAARYQPAAVIIGGAFVGSVVAGLGFVAAPAVGIVLLVVVAAIVVGVVTVLRKGRGAAVCAPRYTLDGVAIGPDEIATLKRIDAKFWQAEHELRALPAGAGVEWSAIEPQAQALMWEAAGHAAQASALWRQIVDLRPADGGPAPAPAQAAILDAANQQRDAHLDALKRIDGEADQLAALAANAAAAASVALGAPSGSRPAAAGDPTTTELTAQSALEDAKQRLAALGAAWTALDSSTEIAAHQLPPEPPPTGS
jgi:hypothetical protein